MTCIRHIRIKNFRGISDLDWYPNSGVNCLIGPGDSGKSTVLDAIDWCLGARRNLQISDADFHNLNTAEEIRIEVTIGNLSKDMMELNFYGRFIRGFSPNSQIEDEPSEGSEAVLTVCLSIGEDLEANWTLLSDRAEQDQDSRDLKWKDRVAIAPTRIGVYADRHFTWQKGSLLNNLANERTSTSAELVEVAREARVNFGDVPDGRLTETLTKVKENSISSGIFVGETVKARLDPLALSISAGAISLHDGNDVPLRLLGLGSSRLLTAMLQRQAGEDDTASIAIVDEVEYGLEPHRIAKFLIALGAKADAGDEKFQVFLTTHSPVVLRELSAEQLFAIRQAKVHWINQVGSKESDAQGVLRSSPEGFLGNKVLVCEGATEIGFIRGLSLYTSDIGKQNLNEVGLVCIDAGGEGDIYKRVNVFKQLGYSVAVFRDNDTKLSDKDKDEEKAFVEDSGQVFQWCESQNTELAVFLNVSDVTVNELIEFAIHLRGKRKVIKNLESASNGSVEIDSFLCEPNEDKRRIIAKAAGSGKWFKRISIMEEVTRTIIAPNLKDANEEFLNVITKMWNWFNS